MDFVILIAAFIIGFIICYLTFVEFECFGQKNTVTLYTWTKCGHCVRFLQSGEWDGVKNDKFTVQHVSTENPSTDPAVAGVDSFPTIRAVISGKTVEYSGPRTSIAINAWLAGL